jgi:hypothetical protein
MEVMTMATADRDAEDNDPRTDEDDGSVWQEIDPTDLRPQTNAERAMAKNYPKVWETLMEVTAFEMWQERKETEKSDAPGGH